MEIIVVRHGESTENVANAMGESYDVNDIKLTQLGEDQAKATGDYLKIYDKINAIYCSPVKRCRQTAEIIAKRIDYKTDIIFDDLLVEAGQISHNMAGLSEKDQTIILTQNENLSMMENNIKNEKNMFVKCDLIKKFHNVVVDYLNVKLTLDDVVQNYQRFFTKIIKNDDHRVLIVGHGGTVEGILAIATGISIHSILQMVRISLKKEKVPKSIPNCCIMGIKISHKSNKINNFELIMPPNDDHISKM